ncbi:ubiquitin-like domain-containing protein [Streptomyces sp. 549]|nr:resuscitation-promoting factor [Streptomyces sp. 549]MDK1476021.1 ubiquitin-like domain-containing protein [Streptomyces sp. 549]
MPAEFGPPPPCGPAPGFGPPYGYGYDPAPAFAGPADGFGPAAAFAGPVPGFGPAAVGEFGPAAEWGFGPAPEPWSPPEHPDSTGVGTSDSEPTALIPNALSPTALSPTVPAPGGPHDPGGEPAAPRAAADGTTAPGGRAAARRAARRGTERPDLLRRLLPQALVVAVLAGGTSAFVAHDKVVELTVDGRPTELRTFAASVADLLAEEGVEVDRHDIVAPAPQERLADGDRVAVRFGRPVALTLDGRHQRVWTTASTVDGALRQLGVRAEGAHLSVSRSRRIGLEGLALDVRTERGVTVLADGRAHRLRTNAATVREALADAGVRLRGEDTASAPLDDFPRDGQTITVQRVTASERVRDESIPYLTERRRDPELLQGTEVVVQPGREGIRRIRYEVRSVDGVRQRPRRVDTEVVRQPQTQIVKVGAKAPPSSVRGADHLNWGALAACESGGRPGAVDASGTYGGLYQFDVGTWQGVGGSGRPQDATPTEQTFRAKKLYVQRGASPWPVCGRKLHQ